MRMDQRDSWRALFAFRSSATLSALVTMLALAAMMASAGFWVPVGLAAQAAGGGGMTYEVYSFSDSEATGLDQVNLLTVPLASTLPLGTYLSLGVYSAWAQGTVRGSDGQEASLTGFTDTEISVALSLGGDNAVLAGGFVLPTGESTQSLDEVVVAGIIAAELLPFAISTWGSGGSSGGDLALAFQAGGWGIGVSGGYRVASEYEPLTDETFTYRPGDQVRARLALDRDVGQSGTLSFLLGYQSFQDDALDEQNLFRAGARYEGLISYAFAAGRSGSGILYGGVNHRENGSVLVEDPALAGATDTPWQQLYRGGFTFLLPVGRSLTLFPEGEARMFRAEDGIGQGFLTSAGFGFDLTLAGGRRGTRIVLSPSGRFHVGDITVDETSDSRVTGWTAGVTLRLENVRP